MQQLNTSDERADEVAVGGRFALAKCVNLMYSYLYVYMNVCVYVKAGRHLWHFINSEISAYLPAEQCEYCVQRAL